MSLLEIKNLHARIEDKEILRGINLTINAGEVHGDHGAQRKRQKHACLGFGRGAKSSRSRRAKCCSRAKICSTSIPKSARAKVCFWPSQYPVEIPGVNTQVFLRAAINGIRKHRGQDDMSAMEFLKAVKEKSKLVELPDNLLKRSVNEGFFGAAKRNARRFSRWRSWNRRWPCWTKPIPVWTSTRFASWPTASICSVRRNIRPWLSRTISGCWNTSCRIFVHVLYQGQIIKSGGKELALQLDDTGYQNIIAEYSEFRKTPSRLERARNGITDHTNGG